MLQNSRITLLKTQAHELNTLPNIKQNNLKTILGSEGYTVSHETMNHKGIDV